MKLGLTGWVPLLVCLAVPETEGTLLDKPAVAPSQTNLDSTLVFVTRRRSDERMDARRHGGESEDLAIRPDSIVAIVSFRC